MYESSIELSKRPHSPGRELDIVDNVQGYNRFQPYNNLGFSQGTCFSTCASSTACTVYACTCNASSCKTNQDTHTGEYLLNSSGSNLEHSLDTSGFEGRDQDQDGSDTSGGGSDKQNASFPLKVRNQPLSSYAPG